MTTYSVENPEGGTQPNERVYDATSERTIHPEAVHTRTKTRNQPAISGSDALLAVQISGDMEGQVLPVPTSALAGGAIQEQLLAAYRQSQEALFLDDDLGDVIAVRIRPGGRSVDLGAIPTVAEERAKVLLSAFPDAAIVPLLRAIRTWIDQHPGAVARAKVMCVDDPEDSGWTEVVVALHVPARTEEALGLWDDLADVVTRTKNEMEPEDRSIIDSAFGVHLIWDEDGEEFD